MKNKTKISKFMSYLLRHDPKMKMDKEGFLLIEDLIEIIGKRYQVDRELIEEIVREDEKGRYEIKGDKIRARYGHSIEISPSLPLASIKKLYHGTTEKAANKILEEGLKPMGRKKIHLSPSIKDAIEVGKRRVKNPFILEIDCDKMRKDGILIQKASEKVYVANYIPPRFIKILKKS